MYKKIAESELILNPDGSVYHLNLKPEEIASTIITVGDPGRVEKVSRHFDRIELRKSKREFITHTGTYKGKRLSVLSTGIGPDNIDIVINELDAITNIDLKRREIKDEKHSLKIIRFGTSGSLQEEIPVDGIVLGTHGIGLDNLMHFYKSERTPEEIDLLDAFHVQLSLEDSVLHPYIGSCAKELIGLFPDDYFRGITVSCPGFYAPQGRVLRAPLAFERLIDDLHSFEFRGYRISNFEMETSGIYGLCNVLGHRCLSVNAIIANRRTRTFSKDAGKAVDNMIMQSLDILAEG